MTTANFAMQAGRPVVATGRRRILGAGLALPGEPVTTDALCQRLHDRFAIRTKLHQRLLAPRLQVHTRHLCRDFLASDEAPRPGQRNPELAASALQQALQQAGLTPQTLGYVISHTATPASLLPGASAEISQLLGYNGPHMELRQACTGFANALQIAFALTAQPGAAPVAVVGSETGSVYFSPHSLKQDSSQWINFLQMGDGAAGIVIAPDDDEGSGSAWIRLPFFGQCQHPPSPGLRLRHGGSDCATPPQGVLLFEHDFSSVAAHGAFLLDAGRAVLSEAGCEVHAARYVVPHQASGAIPPWLAERWSLPVERVYNHAARCGNLGSASIWAALVDLLRLPQRAVGTSVFLGAEATQYSYGGFALELS